LLGIHSSDPREKQKVLESLSQRFKLSPYKKGPYVIENVDSVVPVNRFVEENFSDVRFVSMVEIEVLGGY